LTHHETITAKRAANHGEGDSGSFDIIENDGEFSVYEGGFCHASELDCLEVATKVAQGLADNFDGRSLQDLKDQWLNDPSFDIEETVGFEDCRLELYSFRLETELAAARKEIQRLRSLILPFGELLGEMCGFSR
jgi:hypothetical protein